MLNIKDPETERLVRELAEQTGETLTAAVREAARERLERAQKARRKPIDWAKIDALTRAIKAKAGDEKSEDHAELYDDDGLPR
ncbi:MAG TPA: type II toxin-antitoxin system VapB family antitoxin [Caulobacterales bacterium]|nr:type II toxin-antitoxin system VapB family antitoxin [Caulobacterales bacterium]